MTRPQREEIDADKLVHIARLICSERCAEYGDPPCHSKVHFDGLEWPPSGCTGADGCLAHARKAYEAKPYRMIAPIGAAECNGSWTLVMPDECQIQSS